MKLHWFLNEKELFHSEGDIPLVGQTIYLHDYTSVPPKGKKKYKVVRVDRDISLSVKDMRELKITAKEPYERYYETISIIEKESEGGKVTGVDLPFFKLSIDTAQINLVVDSVGGQPDRIELKT